MRSVRYHPEAQAEFLDQVDYFASISPSLAQRYLTAIRKAEADAAATPEMWPRYTRKTRRVVERRFKFSLVYLHSEREIYVVAVAATSRKPGYWRTRLA